jgi:hypothetical protein
VRCARCGNENLDGNRFCGMCGATLLTTSVPVAAPPAQSSAARSTVPAAASSFPPGPAAGAQPQNPPSSRTSTPVSEQEPYISGPSFLGLNEPAPRKRANLSSDPHVRPSSRNLDYLLDDEEEPRRGGAGKYVLILLALALAVGFGYLRWKNQGFGWLGPHGNKPAATVQDSDSTDTKAAPAPAASSTNAPAPAPAASTAASPAATPPVANPTPPAGDPAPSSSTPSPATGNASPNPAPATGEPTPPDSAATPAATSAAAPPASAAKEPAPTADDTEDTPTEASPKPNHAEDAPPPKPHAGVKPVPQVDPVSEAQKYLYGRGVAQDCERGMRLLKPAANQSNPKAMIEMGALYSAGLCTPHDLPTAYRWFALALRKDPDNNAVQNDLQKLWGEMTQPERQLAIKLSQ